MLLQTVCSRVSASTMLQAQRVLPQETWLHIRSTSKKDKNHLGGYLEALDNFRSANTRALQDVDSMTIRYSLKHASSFAPIPHRPLPLTVQTAARNFGASTANRNDRWASLSIELVSSQKHVLTLSLDLRCRRSLRQDVERRRLYRTRGSAE